MEAQPLTQEGREGASQEDVAKETLDSGDRKHSVSVGHEEGHQDERGA